MTGNREKRYTPIFILVLVAALVVVIGLWATEKSARTVVESTSGDVAGKQNERTFRWKIVTTWPKNFPGLGTAAENFAKLVDGCDIVCREGCLGGSVGDDYVGLVNGRCGRSVHNYGLLVLAGLKRG